MSLTNPADGCPADAPPVPFVKRVRIRNFRSIARCDVELGPLTVLVGRNGAGKSNFLDAIGFVVDALRTSLNQALRSRRVPADLWRMGLWEPRSFEIELAMNLGDERRAVYGLELSRDHGDLIRVLSERLAIEGRGNGRYGSFQVEKGQLVGSSEPQMPPIPVDRLYLPIAAGLPAFRDVYEALVATGFYNLNPEAMKAFRSPDPAEMLRRDGSNIAGVIGRLGAERPGVMEWVKEYLALIVPGITDVNRVILGPVEGLEFRQSVSGPESPRTFYPSNVSDGTLRVLGALVAVAQLADGGNPVRLIGIEEPETALHPAASAALMDALHEAALQTQVIVTTHSPDLLDRVEFEGDRLLVAEMRDGDTVIGSVDRASRDIIKEDLYTAGELLRMEQLQPDYEDLQRQLNVSEPAGRAE